MSDYAGHWQALIVEAIGYIAPDSINGKRLKPVLEQIRKEAQDMASAHMNQALMNGMAALASGEEVARLQELLREIRGDYACTLGITEAAYREWCRIGAPGRQSNDTWPRHCQRRMDAIDQAIAQEGQP